MPLPTRTLTDDEQEHLDDHNNIIKPVIDDYEGTDPSQFAAAVHSHTATQTPFTAGGSISSTNVQTAVNEVAADAATALTAHLNDTVDAHDASAISITATGAVVENNVQDAIENLDQRVTGIASISSPLGVAFSTLAGTTDDQRLANYNLARTTAGSGLFGWPVILDGNRVYDFNAGITISSGFSMIDAISGTDQNRGTTHPVGNVVDIAGVSGGWLNLPSGNNFGIHLAGLSINGDSSSRVFGLNAAGELWTSSFENISVQNALSFMGSSSVKQLMTICSIGGIFSSWNNWQDTALNIGGSDSAIDYTRCNFDTTTSLLGPTAYIMRIGGLSKTYIKGLYITAEQHSALLVSQSNQMLTFDKCIFEGRNTGAPCFGALVRDSSTFSSYRDCWFGYAMSAPASGSNAGDLGYVHITGGTHEFHGCHFRLATGQSAGSTAFIYATGSTARVVVTSASGEGNSAASQTEGAWFAPRVRVITGSGATHDVDSSVTLVTT